MDSIEHTQPNNSLSVVNGASPKPAWTVAPVGRTRGRRLGGISSGIVRREGRERGESRTKPAQHHEDHSVDPWFGMIS